VTAPGKQGLPNTQLYVVLGAGGVGKTTTAAALGLSFAEQGKRTVVITVDPAKRLAQVLGLSHLSNQPQEVLKTANGGSMSALWLDPSSAMEELIRKYAGDPEKAARILNHRLFKIIQSQLGGIEEYLGVEKVLELGRSGHFDLCILDTPPSQHALDFLESPRHLLRFFDDGVLKIFLKEEETEPERGFFSGFKKIFKTARQQALEIFKSFLGGRFVNELGELLSYAKPIQKVFTQTAADIEEWVREESTRFILVTLLEPYPVDESRLLGAALVERDLPAAHLLVLNKCLPSAEPPLAGWRDALGAEAARNMAEMHKMQCKLRSRVEETRDPQLVIAEVLRYSAARLSREQLLGMGNGIRDLWLSKNPKLFSKP